MLDLNTLRDFAIKDVKARPGIVDRTFNLKTGSTEGYVVEGWTGKSRAQQDSILRNWRSEAQDQGVAEGTGQGAYGRKARKGGKPSRARRTIARGVAIYYTKGADSFEYKQYLKQHPDQSVAINNAIEWGEEPEPTAGGQGGQSTSPTDPGTSGSWAAEVERLELETSAGEKTGAVRRWLPTTTSWKRCYHCGSRAICYVGDVVYCYKCYGEARVVSSDA
jgi:hypothetical protein